MYVPFTGLGLRNGFRGNVWLANRIKIFKNFVLPSLLNQTNRNFILWVSWRPEEETNPLVLEFYDTLKNIRDLQVIFTFHGLCFWDDKYSDSEARLRLKRSLTLTLPELKEIVGKSDVYMTIQPSDDMYLSSAVADIQFRPSSYGYTKGYIIDYSTKEIAEYNPETYPPFFNLVFTNEEFFNPETELFYYKSHEQQPVKVHFDKRMFCVGTHGENISTVFNHPFKGRTLEGTERDNVLMQLGIYWQDPVVTRTGLRLYGRKVLNQLPFNDQIRKIYHKTPWHYF